MVIRTRLPESAMRSPQAVAGEPAEHLGVDHPEPGAGQHGDRQLRDHGHVQGDPVAGLSAAEVLSSAANSFTRR